MCKESWQVSTCHLPATSRRGILLFHQISRAHHHHHMLLMPSLGVIQGQVTPNQRLDLHTHSHTLPTARHRNNLNTARHRNNLNTARHRNNLHTERHRNNLHTADHHNNLHTAEGILVSTSSRRISHLLAMTMANRHILDGVGRTTMGSSHSCSNQGRIHKHRTMPRGLTLLNTRITTIGLSEIPSCSAATIWFLFSCGSCHSCVYLGEYCRWCTGWLGSRLYDLYSVIMHWHVFAWLQYWVYGGTIIFQPLV
ncbi:hypothetical protein ACQ4PT_052108 [Festuca glaucescens]